MDYEFLRADLHTHIVALEESDNDLIKKNRLRDKINLLKAKISQINLERGKNLAGKMKTKWYNEGERSNKYFLGLLKRKEKNGELNELEISGATEKDPDIIEAHVRLFYEQLYNQNQNCHRRRSHSEAVIAMLMMMTIMAMAMAIVMMITIMIMARHMIRF